MNVPIINLHAHHARLRGELAAVIKQVIDESAFAGGPFVSRFEEDFARFCGVDYFVGVGSGTDALWLALLAPRHQQLDGRHKYQLKRMRTTFG